MVISTNRAKERELVLRSLRERLNSDEPWIRTNQLGAELARQGHGISPLTALQAAKWLRDRGLARLVNDQGKTWVRATTEDENRGEDE